MVSLDCTVMSQDIGEYLFQLSSTGINLGEKLVHHVHSGHIVTKNTNEHLGKVCSTDGLTHST